LFPRTMEMKTDLWNGIPIEMTKHNKAKMINHEKMILDMHTATANWSLQP